MVSTQHSEAIERALLPGIVQQTSVVLFGNVSMAAINIALLWERLPHDFLLPWLMVFFLVMMCRILLAYLYHLDPYRCSITKWHVVIVTSSLLQGVVWCVLALYASTILDFTGISVLVITLAGLTAGAVATTSSYSASFLSFSCPALLPISFVLLSDDGYDTKAVGLLVFIFFYLTYKQMTIINTVLRENISNNIALGEAKLQADSLAKELYELSTMDALTKITNRRGFDELYRREWMRAKRLKSPLSLLMIDVDYFKKYNDKLGHQAGDLCLKDIAAELLLHARRPTDCVARYGGEEFIVCLPDTALDQALLVGNNLCGGIKALGIQHPNSSVDDVITVSIGLYSMVPDDDVDSRVLIECSDKALYRAKSLGRNQVYCYGSEATD